MPTKFTSILTGELPCHKILEDADFLAFLNINPVKPGHTLVIPKKEIDYIFDMDDKDLGALVVFAKKAARLLRSRITYARIGVMVAGLEVRHAHIHLVPISSVDDLNFRNARPAGEEELQKMAAKIRGS